MTTSTPSSASTPLKSKKVLSKNGKVYYKYRDEHYFIDSDKFPLDKTKCGRRSNFLAHRRRAETPCDPCSEANKRYHKNWRELRKLKKLVSEMLAKLEETEGDTK